MAAVYIIIVLMALMPQVLFTVLYWKWIPGWVKNPYGRMAQFDSASLIALLIFFLAVVVFGNHLGQPEKRVIAALLMVPFIFAGYFRLVLLKRAVDSAHSDEKKEESK